MAQIITASIDLSKIDKKKIVEGKNGAKYYDILITVNDEPNQYGQNVSLSNSQTKEQREAKEKKTYIGNGKTIWNDGGKVSDKAQSTNQQQSSSAPSDDDLPFALFALVGIGGLLSMLIF